MTMEQPIYGVCVANGMLQSAQWDLTINFYNGRPAKDTDPKEFESLVEATYHKISYWLQVFMQELVVVDGSKSQTIRDLADHVDDNIVMTLPGTPNDLLVLKAIYCKLVALADGVMHFGYMSIKRHGANMSFTIGRDDATNEMPTDATYAGPGPLHPAPWWDRDDVDSYDTSDDSVSDERREEIRSKIDTSHIMRNFVEDLMKDDEEIDDAEGEIIDLGDIWEPTVE